MAIVDGQFTDHKAHREKMAPRCLMEIEARNFRHAVEIENKQIRPRLLAPFEPPKADGFEITQETPPLE